MITKADLITTALTLRSCPYRSFSLRQVSAVLALFFIALWAFWRYIVRRQLIATGTEDEHSRLRRNPTVVAQALDRLDGRNLTPVPSSTWKTKAAQTFAAISLP